MDTSKLKVKLTGALTAGISAVLIYAVLSACCMAVYYSTNLSELFNIDPTYWQWLGIVFITSILFNDIPITFKNK